MLTSLWLQIVERVCKEAQKQARIYQESIRDMAELEDTTGVELFQGRDSGKARSMMAIKAEKIQRAKSVCSQPLPATYASQGNQIVCVWS